MPPFKRYAHLRRLAEAVGAGAYGGRNSSEFGLELIRDGLARVLEENFGLVEMTVRMKRRKRLAENREATG